MNAYMADCMLTDKAQELCEKLYLAAKKNKNRRFHQLYDKIYRVDIFYDSWCMVRKNNGCAGVDDICIADVQRYCSDKFIHELHELLHNSHKYHPKRIKRVFIPNKWRRAT